MIQEQTIAVKVTQKTKEAVDICRIDLAATNDNPLPPFSAGSHVDVNLPNGLIRQYSLCGSPSDTSCYSLGVLNAPESRGASRYIHENLAEKDIIHISAPRNQFPLCEGAQHHVLIAGGIGITPILCMARHLATVGGSFDLHYTSRSADRMAFAADIRSAPFAPQSRLYFSDDGPGHRLDLLEVLRCPDPGTHIYVCGPKGLIDAVLATSTSAGWTEDRLHREYFAAPIQEGSGDRAFDVKLARSGMVIPVSEGTTVVEALADAGIELLTSCEQGVCGTCVTRILDGIPDHRDVFLTPAQHELNNQFTPCCSRSKTSLLVLDL